MRDTVMERGTAVDEAGGTQLFRSDHAHPLCRACGDDLVFSAPGGRMCSCGWTISGKLQALLAFRARQRG